jgi:phage baseplate assembly protein V
MQSAAAGMDAFQGVARRGIVVNFDAASFRARVTIQPSGMTTGWLPVLSPWVGAGWGLVMPLQLNDQVLVLAEDGDSGNGVIVGRYFSDVDAPPQGVGGGEFLLRHDSGSQLLFKADGSVSLMAAVLDIAAPGGGNATVNITGSLNVSVETTTAGKAFTPHSHPYLPGTGGQTQTGAPQG